MQVHTSLAGNLVEDPTYRITPAGHAVVNLRVAVNDRYQDHTTGEWKDGDTVYLTVTGWRRLAENTAESLHKGDGVLIIGRLTQRDYETGTGEKRTTYQLDADHIGASLAHATIVGTRNPKTGADAAGDQVQDH